MIKIGTIMGGSISSKEMIVLPNVPFKTKNQPSYTPQLASPLSFENHKKILRVTIWTLERLSSCGYSDTFPHPS